MVKRIRDKPRHNISAYARKPADGRHSSRLTNGRDLLPNEDGRSKWSRLLKSTMKAMIAHCGDAISDTQRMACRRIGALEAELVFQEDRIAKIRRQGKEPPASLIKTYSLLSYQQRRLMIDIGWEKTANGTEPNNEPQDLADYIHRKVNAKSGA
jgi:hypothetical protein